tara:strand:+ start:40 stop:414 length:375 start_codon:yes stop_codon:yes gene_type:complete
MKISKRRLKEIIKEELNEAALVEAADRRVPMGHASADPGGRVEATILVLSHLWDLLSVYSRQSNSYAKELRDPNSYNSQHVQGKLSGDFSVDKAYDNLKNGLMKLQDDLEEGRTPRPLKSPSRE